MTHDPAENSVATLAENAPKKDAPGSLCLAPGWAFGKLATFESVSLSEANQMLTAWGHKMGPLARGDQRAWCHALTHNGNPVAVTTASYLIAPVVGNAHWLTRENTVELSRLCAARGGLCRVALRMWREFVLPALPFATAVSYQDADLHNGHTYRCDGWERVARSRSGVDTRSGRPGRDKWVWQYPPRRSPDTWGGKCKACGALWRYLPESDNGVCAACGCHAVVGSDRPLPPNEKMSHAPRVAE